MYTIDRFKISHTEQGVLLENTDIILKGMDIRNHLENCGECGVLCATLGINVDNIIRITQNITMSEEVVLDACAVEFIEKLCDKVCGEFEEELLEECLNVTSRFSPGYGDLGIEIQSEILRIANSERRIGLTVTDTNIMLPRKSVSAIIGIYNGAKKNTDKRNCENCNLKNSCKYRKRGVRCND